MARFEDDHLQPREVRAQRLLRRETSDLSVLRWVGIGVDHQRTGIEVHHEAGVSLTGSH